MVVRPQPRFIRGIDYQLSIDVCDAAAIDPILDTARAAAAEDRLWLCHPEWQVVAGWRTTDPDVRLVDSTRLRRIKEGPERRAASLASAGIDALNMHYTDWTGGLTTLLHRFGRLAFAWDLQHEALLRTTIRMGVDAIYSDHTDRMMDALAAEQI